MDGGTWRVFEPPTAEEGCAYILDDGERCDATRKPKSSNCAVHHALCDVPEGSRRERRRLRETEALANAVGGRSGRAARTPPDPFLRRLENVARHFLRTDRSRIVLKGDK